MYAPKEIIDFLESILGIYLSDIRHKERSAFILTDNLIEICCKTRIKEMNPADNNFRKFQKSLKDTRLNKKLIEKLLKRHQIRNDMQHVKLGITVDNQDCACAILGSIKVINKLWGKYALDNSPSWVTCALRIVELYSDSSNHMKIKSFEKKLLKDVNWNIDEINVIDVIDDKRTKHKIKSRRFPNKNEMIIEIGNKNYWILLVREKTNLVDQCLDEIL